VATYFAPSLAGRPGSVEFGIFEPAEQAEISVPTGREGATETRGSNRPYPFSGVLVCAECLQPLWHQLSTNKRTHKDGTHD
jgi:site-specific DNA recombinase